MRTFFTILAAAVLGAAATAWADPDPSQSTGPDHIVLVGVHQGVPDPIGRFDVVVRDAVGTPMPSQPVTIDFSACGDLVASASQPFPGQTVDCDGKTVTATSDANGVARFLVAGSVLHRGPASLANTVRILAGASNVFIKNIQTVACFDLDGVNGIDANDLALYACDLCQGLCCITGCPLPQRTDYNQDGVNTVADETVLENHYWAETSSETAPRCDGQSPMKPTVVATEGGLDLRWTECVDGGGSSLATFACNTNSGSRSLVFSFVAPPGVDDVTAYEAEAMVASAAPSTPLPDWWRWDACRIASAFPVAAGRGSCPDPTDGSGAVAMRMDYPWVGPFAARLRFVSAATMGALTPGQEYALFRLNIDSQKTTGTGACAGCDEPVQIVFQSLKLIRGGGCGDPALTTSVAAPPDVLIESESTSRRAYWQQVIANVERPARHSSLAVSRAPSSPGELVVDFTLPSAAPAALDVYDLGGRHLATRALVGFGAGVHRLSLGGASPLWTGMYFVRLQQGAAIATLETSIMR